MRPSLHLFPLPTLPTPLRGQAVTDTPAVEFATVGQTSEGKIYHRLWSADEIMALLKENELAKDDDAEEN